MQINFYTGPDCSLCDDAKLILEQFSNSLSEPIPLSVQYFNIREQSDLYHLYATRIPVLKRTDTGAELGWPFNLESLKTFLK